MGDSVFPVVAGHGVVGHVAEVGSSVTGFAVGDPAGVGCFVDSRRTCAPCEADLEPFCEQGTSGTYDGTGQDAVTRTHGGDSTRIVVDRRHVLRVMRNLDLAAAAPLLR